MNYRQQHTAVQTEELQNTTDIYNMSVGPEGEMFPLRFVLQENTPMSTHTPQDTGEKESQASREDLLNQNEELREQLKRQKKESQAFQKDMIKIIWGLKTRPQTQFEEWKENILKQHKEEMSLLKDEKTSAFSALKEEARKAVEKEIDELNAIIFQLKRTEHKKERQIQGLLDTITRKTHQVEALKQNHEVEQMEKEALKRQVFHLQSSLDQQEWAYKAAQNKVKRQRQKLYTKVDKLKSALDQEKCSTREVQSQLELQEGESQELEKKVSFLTSALTAQRSIISEAESKLQTLQNEKVGLESIVKELHCRVTEQEEMIQEQQARTQTLNLDIQTERVTSKDVIKCYTAHVSALAQIIDLKKQVTDSSQENESLKNSLKEQLRNAEQEIEELSEALIASEETNSALRQENKELQETLATNEEKWKERVRLKKRKRWWLFRRT